MGKHKRRSRNKTDGLAYGCPFFIGQRVFDGASGHFMGIVTCTEYDTERKDWVATLDTTTWYWGKDLDDECSIGQRVEGVGSYGPISDEAYSMYDAGIVEDVIGAPHRAENLVDALRRREFERLCAAERETSEYEGGGQYFGGC